MQRSSSATTFKRGASERKRVLVLPMSLPLFPNGDDPGPSFTELLARTRGGGAQRSWARPTSRGNPAGRSIAPLPAPMPGSRSRHHDRGPPIRRRRRHRRRPPGDRGQHDRPPQHREGLPGRPALCCRHRWSCGHRDRDGAPFSDPARTLREGRRGALSLEGKANQLGQMVGANLPMAMQGLVVIPLFAGYDLRLKKGRIFTYDVTGGRFEETDFHATGSGGRDAKNTVKLGYREQLARDEAVELAVSAFTRQPTRTLRPGVRTRSEASTQSSRPSTPRVTRAFGRGGGRALHPRLRAPPRTGRKG